MTRKRSRFAFSFNPSVNKMLQNETIPPCEKVLVEGTNPIPIFFLGDPAYPSLLFLMKKYSGCDKYARETFFIH